MSLEKLPYFDPSQHPLAGKIDDITKRLERLEDVLIPLEPVYPMTVVARLLCISLQRLRDFLKRNRHIYLPRYMHVGRNHCRMRFLTSHEIRQIRRSLFRGPGAIDL